MPITQTKILVDGPAVVIAHLTCIIDADNVGETDVVKIDGSDLDPPAANLALEEIWFSTQGMSVRLEYQASGDQTIWLIPENMSDHLDFRTFGGIRPFDAAGVNFAPDVLVTTVGHAAGDTYTIIMKFRKTKGLPTGTEGV